MKLVEKAMQKREFDENYTGNDALLDTLGVLVSIYRKADTLLRKPVTQVLQVGSFILLGYAVLVLYSWLIV
ncbi:hypothetical protein F400_gp006 [Bacillus phage BCD7]|uniref:Uncharacterized protein n=1 Tax=Bacillus phage BCD7 TaxID=1136534 RepID=J9PTX0_9CAUD|nr:hypothetical protein F400_gp006 [Bacillus phage BCD7]AEZ50453.1 hypothetical protein BCD7_0006 [Bacillus phage BCD7]